MARGLSLLANFWVMGACKKREKSIEDTYAERGTKASMTEVGLPFEPELNPIEYCK